MKEDFIIILAFMILGEIYTLQKHHIKAVFMFIVSGGLFILYLIEKYLT